MGVVTGARQSIRPDGLVSFEDGRTYKSLKRHLTVRGLTPAQYRQKWGLPPDYPMVAASYSAARAELARAIGLGRKQPAEVAPEPEPPKARIAGTLGLFRKRPRPAG